MEIEYPCSLAWVMNRARVNRKGKKRDRTKRFPEAITMYHEKAREYPAKEAIGNK